MEDQTDRKPVTEIKKLMSQPEVAVKGSRVINSLAMRVKIANAVEHSALKGKVPKQIQDAMIRLDVEDSIIICLGFLKAIFVDGNNINDVPEHFLSLYTESQNNSEPKFNQALRGLFNFLQESVEKLWNILAQPQGFLVYWMDSLKFFKMTIFPGFKQEFKLLQIIAKSY